MPNFENTDSRGNGIHSINKVITTQNKAAILNRPGLLSDTNNLAQLM